MVRNNQAQTNRENTSEEGEQWNCNSSSLPEKKTHTTQKMTLEQKKKMVFVATRFNDLASTYVENITLS